MKFTLLKFSLYMQTSSVFRGARPLLTKHLAVHPHMHVYLNFAGRLHLANTKLKLSFKPSRSLLLQPQHH